MMNKKKWFVPLMAIFFLLVAAPIAEAHVTVHPGESSTNAYEKYTVRIPVEKDANTTKVELVVPEGVNLVSVLPMEGWKYKLDKDENDMISKVTWTAKDKGIGPNEFIEFAFIGANPDEPGEFSWEAHQTYDDGSVVDWDGPPDADEPASVTKVVKGDAVAEHDDNATADTKESDESDDSSSTSGTGGWLPTTLAVVAILLALISLFRKRV
ncbi:YcnI family protein [Lentibacillus sp. N15]|uniref:YcnI family copper-binding membrane protein n=1 Tax=Lentibacillus songyuanensis TaxID=3136161 RepID=UPI0031BB7BAA